MLFTDAEAKVVSQDGTKRTVGQVGNGIEGLQREASSPSERGSSEDDEMNTEDTVQLESECSSSPANKRKQMKVSEAHGTSVNKKRPWKPKRKWVPSDLDLPS